MNKNIPIIAPKPIIKAQPKTFFNPLPEHSNCPWYKEDMTVRECHIAAEYEIIKDLLITKADEYSEIEYNTLVSRQQSLIKAFNKK